MPRTHGRRRGCLKFGLSAARAAEGLRSPMPYVPPHVQDREPRAMQVAFERRLSALERATATEAPSLPLCLFGALSGRLRMSRAAGSMRRYRPAKRPRAGYGKAGVGND